MNKSIVLAALLLAACSSGPRVPDWQLNAQAAGERAVSAYLEGHSAVADREFAQARRQVASTGQPALVIRIELLRCAAHLAALAMEPCSGYEALRADASPADEAYARYLTGSASAADAALLPEAQRPVLAAGSEPAAASAAGAIADPLSQLVAAGALLRAGRATPALVEQAIATASAQGWRRPLLAWLHIALQRAEQGGDQQAAARLRRRIALASAP